MASIFSLHLNLHVCLKSFHRYLCSILVVCQLHALCEAPFPCVLHCLYYCLPRVEGHVKVSSLISGCGSAVPLPTTCVIIINIIIMHARVVIPLSTGPNGEQSLNCYTCIKIHLFSNSKLNTHDWLPTPIKLWQLLWSDQSLSECSTPPLLANF